MGTEVGEEAAKVELPLFPRVSGERTTLSLGPSEEKKRKLGSFS